MPSGEPEENEQRPSREELRLDLGKVSEAATEATKPLDTGRSITEIPEESSIQTARSESADIPSPPQKLEDTESVTKTTEKAVSIQSDIAKPISEEIETESREFRDDEDKSEAESEKASKRSVSQYSEDFSSSSSVMDSRTSESSLTTTTSSKSTEPSVKSAADKSREVASSTKASERPPLQKEESEDMNESIYTEEDISEALSEGEEAGLKFDLSAPVPIATEDPIPSFKIGDRVLVGGVQEGTLLFKGVTKFAPGFWTGVALDKPEGKNDGSIEGEVYFTCAADHGLFVPPDKLSVLGSDMENLDQAEEGEESVPGTMDSEMETVIRKASAAVEDFLTKPDLPEEADRAKPNAEPVHVAMDIDEEPTKSPKTSKPDEAADLAVQNLLNEALSQMIAIRTRKRDVVQQTDTAAEQAPSPAKISRPASDIQKLAEIPEFKGTKSSKSSLVDVLGLDTPVGVSRDDSFLPPPGTPIPSRTGKTVSISQSWFFPEINSQPPFLKLQSCHCLNMAQISKSGIHNM